MKIVENQSNQAISKNEEGIYSSKNDVLLTFERKVQGAYHQQIKKENDYQFSQWQQINPMDYKLLIDFPGTTIINYKASGGFIRLPFEQQIKINYNILTGLDLDYENEMYVGESQTIKTIINTTGLIPNMVFSWSSSSNSILSVDENGRVVALSPGEATITVSPIGYPITEIANIKVVEIPTISLEFQHPYYRMKVNQSRNLRGHLRIYPENFRGSDKLEFNWSSSNPEVFTIDSDGRGVAKQDGISVVTATYKDNPLVYATTIIIVGNGSNNNVDNDYRW